MIAKILSRFDKWPSAQECVRKVFAMDGFKNIPVSGLVATGATVTVYDEAVRLVLGSLMVSIMLIDDILDDEDDGYFHKVGYGDSTNISAVLQALGAELLLECSAEPQAKLQALKLYNQTVIDTARGQHLDVTSQISSEEAYWEVVASKSGPFYSFEFQIKAVLADADAGMCHDLAYLGGIYGEIIQIHDDLQDCLQPQVTPDWERSAISLPILFAEQVDHPQRERFIALRQGGIDSAEKLREAQAILLRCGAINYCYVQLLQRYRYATIYLRNSTLPNPAPVQEIFQLAVQPVLDLLKKEGIIITLDAIMQDALAL